MFFALSLERPPLDWISLGRYQLPCVSKDVIPEPYVRCHRGALSPRCHPGALLFPRRHPGALCLKGVILEPCVSKTYPCCLKHVIIETCVQKDVMPEPYVSKTSSLNSIFPRRHLRVSKTSFMNPKPYPQMRHP